MHKIKPKSPYQVAIIGAGFAGLGAGIRLKENNITSFIILERAASVGGTWRDNTYPGCACDVPSHMYSFSFELNPNWSRAFSKQPEILSYIQRCTRKHALEEHIQFNTTIQKLVFDETSGQWELFDQHGKVTAAKTVIVAIGPLNVPVFPKIKGMENFAKTSFHTSEWNHEVDLTGKRVAIIGTGASAIQVVPSIAPIVSQLTVFQRTPPWILPKRDKEFSGAVKKIFQLLPILPWLYRELIYWFMELRGKGMFGNQTILKLATGLAKQHIKKSIADPELRQKVTPNYQIGCKRVLPSDDYYPALERPNVELVTEPIEHISQSAIHGKNGSIWEVDVLIYATGFEAAEFNNRGMDIVGRHGRHLFAEWKTTGAQAYYGITASGFPGLLFMLGPNTGLGHNSVVHMMESQLNYILDYLKKLPADSYLDVKLKVQQIFNEKLQKELSKTVWASGCQSWYQTSSGRNTTLWSGPTYQYRKLTKKVNLSDYESVSVGVEKPFLVL
jgi:cation diffusion facilitator CzcD-associated flavoprotein CzcO